MTERDHIVISQAMTQAMELDGVYIADFRDGAIPLSTRSMGKLRTLTERRKTRAAIMAKLDHAADLAAEHATATIALDLPRDEAQAIVQAVLACVDFDDDRMAESFTHLGEDVPEALQSQASKVRDFLARRNALRLAILRKLYAAAGIALAPAPAPDIPA